MPALKAMALSGIQQAELNAFLALDAQFSGRLEEAQAYLEAGRKVDADPAGLNSVSQAIIEHPPGAPPAH